MQSKETGFTLIETIIYSAIVSMAIAATLFIVYQIIDSRYKILARVEVEEEAQFLMGKVKWVLSSIDKINTPSLGATSSVLSVDKLNFLSNPVILSASGTDVFISYGANASSAINSESVLVKNLVFKNIGLPDNPAVELSFFLEHKPRGQLTIYNATTSIRSIIYARKK
jgi:type II secretory pathway pseudopilin PulG